MADTESAYPVSSLFFLVTKPQLFSGAKQLQGGLDHGSINQTSNPLPIFPAFLAAISDLIT